MRPRWRDTVTRVRAPLIADEYGTPNALRDWAHAAQLIISGCSAQPLVGEEYEIGRESITTRWRLFAPADADLLATDRIKWKGLTYEIDGEPVRYAGNHVEAYLRRVTG